MILEGKKIAEEFKIKLKKEIEDNSLTPSLAVIQVGNDLASNSYVLKKEKLCHEIGIKLKYLKYEEDITTKRLTEDIEKLNQDINIDGIIVLLPLPKHLNQDEILNKIDPKKDIDGLTVTNMGKLFLDISCQIPSTALAIITLLKYYNIEIAKKHIVIVGRSNIVSKPLFLLLLKENATVSICHSKTLDLAHYTNDADILISAVGNANLITEDMVKKDATIIDVGTNIINGKIYGDVYYDAVKNKVKNITPIVNGIGPITSCILLSKVVDNAKNKICEKI